MVTRERTMKVITQLFPASLVAIILYTVKFRRPVFVAMRNNFLVIMLTWKPSAKFFIYVPIIEPSTFFVRMERFSISNSSSVYGGINLTATPHQVFTIWMKIFMTILLWEHPLKDPALKDLQDLLDPPHIREVLVVQVVQVLQVVIQEVRNVLVVLVQVFQVVIQKVRNVLVVLVQVLQVVIQENLKVQRDQANIQENLKDHQDQVHIQEDLRVRRDQVDIQEGLQDHLDQLDQAVIQAVLKDQQVRELQMVIRDDREVQDHKVHLVDQDLHI